MSKPSFFVSGLSLFFYVAIYANTGFAQIQNPNVPRPGDFSTNSTPLSSSDDPDISRTPAVLLEEQSEPKSFLSVDIKEFDVLVSDAQLKAKIQTRLTPFVGPGKSFDDIRNAANAVSIYMQSELGFYLAYAYIPEQTIEGGRIRIAVLQGVLDEVVVNWKEDLLIDKGVIESYLSRLRPGTVIRVSEVERVVLLLNDLKGLQAKFEVREGSKPGTAKLVVTPFRGQRLSANVGIDGNGSRFTGTYRVNASAFIASPFGQGDALTVNHLASTTGAVDFSLAGYILPLGNNGFRLGANISQLNYQLPQADFPLGLEGEASTSSLFAVYPNVRSRNLNVFSIVALEQKSYEDRVNISSLLSDRTVDVARISLVGDARDSHLGGGVSSFDLSLSQGDVSYKSRRPTGLDDAEDFLRFNYDLARLNNIVTGKWLLLSSLKGQYTSENLDVSEQCRIGGADQVRAFSAGEGSGDVCIVASTELRYVVPKRWLGDLPGDMTIGTFYDYGRVTRRADPTSQSQSFVNSAVLSGYGVGVNWERASDFQFRLSVAWKDDGTEMADPKIESPRVFFSATKAID